MLKEKNKIEVNCFTIDLLSRKFFIGNKSIFLRNKEFSLMQYFMNNQGIVLTRSKLLEEVWDRNIFCITNTVDVHVSNLRCKLNLYFDKEVIKTVHCVGYIFELE